MSPRTRLAVEEAALTTALFVAGFYFYFLIGVVAFSDHLRDDLLKAYLLGPAIHVEIVLGGMVFGVLLWGVNLLAHAPVLRHRSFGVIVLAKTVAYTGAFGVCMAVVNVVFLATFFSRDDLLALAAATSPWIHVGLTGWVIFSILGINFLLEVRRKVGPGNLLALLTGRYQRPRMEDRVFLFMDLMGSTSIAERLGPAEYSRFIRHCFHELTDVVVSQGAHVYQYVGDEVVLTWPGTSRDAREHCVRAYYQFRSRLDRRAEWYRAQFDCAPVFRGGIEAGPVAATEVGDVKREIAFHGDALNTAARLLELSKEVGGGLMVTEPIRAAVAGTPDFKAELHGQVRLRGQRHETSVYVVAPA